jgi:hypothetical protein
VETIAASSISTNVKIAVSPMTVFLRPLNMIPSLRKSLSIGPIGLADHVILRLTGNPGETARGWGMRFGFTMCVNPVPIRCR